jgi:hypothetical protein
VGRAQIYLGEVELALLDELAARTGASRSELVRRAVRERYGHRPADVRLAALNAGAGAWADRSFTGAEYTAAVRRERPGAGDP